MNNKSLLIGAGAVVLLIIIVMTLSGGSNAEPTTENMETVREPASPTPSPVTGGVTGGVSAGVSTGEVKSFMVAGSNFAFSPNVMRVKQGDRVKITLTGAGYPHDLKIDALGVATKVINAGQTDTIEFTATTKGTFEYYCSVGNHRQMGMVGSLIVE